MKRFAVCSLAVTLGALVARADVFITKKNHTDPIAMHNQTVPARDWVSKQWIGESRMAIHNDDISIIVDNGAKKMLLINHKGKTFTPMALPPDLSKHFPPNVAKIMQAATDSVKVKVTPRKDKEQVEKWPCGGYDIEIGMTMMGMPMQTQMKVWASKDVPFDWKKAAALVKEATRLQMRLNEAAAKELDAIEGFWIATEMAVNVMGQEVKTKSQVQTIEEKAPEPTTYAVPEGYQEQMELPLMGLAEQAK
jgi:hypothetical protein